MQPASEPATHETGLLGAVSAGLVGFYCYTKKIQKRIDAVAARILERNFEGRKINGIGKFEGRDPSWYADINQNTWTEILGDTCQPIINIKIYEIFL